METKKKISCIYFVYYRYSSSSKTNVYIMTFEKVVERTETKENLVLFAMYL